MSVRFVVGRAGSGKTRHCLQAITAAIGDAPLGPPIFWLLPRSATFQTERMLSCGAGLKGFFRCRVASIESFIQTILEESGRADVAEITPVGRRMILGHLLKREAEALRYFRGAAQQVGLAQRLDATFAEIERADRSQAELQTVFEAAAKGEGSGDAAAADPMLADKLHDLHHLYQAYCRYIGQERLDPHRRMEVLLDRIEQSPLLRGASLYVDAFTYLSDAECRILAAAARAAKRMEITLLMDPSCGLLSNAHHRSDEFALFHRTEDLYRRLWFTFSQANVTVGPPLKLDTIHRFESAPVLEGVERLLADGAAPAATEMEQPASGDSEEAPLCFIEAPDRAGEVDAAARQIQQWTRQGMRLREIAVLARDLEAYHHLIAASFSEHRLAFFMDRRRTASHHPVLQLLNSALQVAHENWAQDAMLSLLKSGLGGVTPDEADEIENYVLAHRIRGAGWARQEPWAFISDSNRSTEEPTPQEQEVARRVDGLRRKAVDPLRPLVGALRQGEAVTVGPVIGELRGLLQRYQVPVRIEQWMRQAAQRGDFEVQAEHQRVWDELLSLLEQMEQLLGDQSMGLGDFLGIFQTALAGFDLALTPPTLDQVLVGQLDRSVIPSVRGVIVLGLNEGEFPATPREDSILNDTDRRALGRRNLNLEPDTRRQLLDERLLAYVAMTRASNRLCLMRHRSDESGKAVAPSLFWLNVQQHHPAAPLTVLSDERAHGPDRIGTPRQLVTGLMDWVWSAEAAPAAPPTADSADLMPPPTPYPALYQWLAAGSCDGGMVDWLRDRAWSALSYENRATLPQPLARLLFDSPLEATAGQLESFAACPFQHFLRHGLNLRQRREDQEVSGRDLSHLYHRVLRRLVQHMLQQRSDWSTLEPRLSEQLIARYTQEIGVALKSEWMLSSGRNQYLLGRVARMLNQVVAHQRAVAARGNFAPAFAEVGFGRNQPLPAWTLRTPGGNQLNLRGRIDRIDLLKSGAAAVVDYRLNGQTLSLAEVYHGLSLQLLISLMVVRDGSGQNGPSALPAAAFYLQMIRKLHDVAHPREAGDPDAPEFELKLKPRGLLDARYLPDLDNALEHGASAVVNAFLKTDGTCGNLDRTDVAVADQLGRLLDHVRTLVGRLADRILEGNIAIRPYRLGQTTPCPRCEFRSVCRFDPAIDRYHWLTPKKRSQVLEEVGQAAQADDTESDAPAQTQ